jgi:hypothetical protein
VAKHEPTLREIITYILAHEAIAMAIAFAGLFLIGIVSMTFVLLDHKRNPVHPLEFAIRNEMLDVAWRRVRYLFRRRRFGAALFRAFGAFWGEYRNLKAMSEMGRLDWAFIWGGVRLAIACVSFDFLAMLVRVWDLVKDL